MGEEKFDTPELLLQDICVVCGVEVLVDPAYAEDDILCAKHWFADGDDDE